MADWPTDDDHETHGEYLDREEAYEQEAEESFLATRLIERMYSDPAAAQERAMIWKRLGLRSIQILPYTEIGTGRRMYCLTGFATDEQVRRL